LPHHHSPIWYNTYVRIVYLVIAAIALAGLSAWAQPPSAVSMREYADIVGRRVRDKIAEALDNDGRDAEVSGVVTYADENGFFIQRDGEGMKVLTPDGVAALHLGDMVVASGKPTLDGGRVVFAAKSWRKTGRVVPPRPIKVDIADITGDNGAEVKENWCRIELCGRVMGVTENGLALSADGVPVSISVDPLPDFAATSGDTHPKVCVRGVLESVLDQSVLAGRESKVIGVRVNVVSPDEIMIIPDVSYMMAVRDRKVRIVALWLAGLLSVGILVFLVLLIRQRRRMFRARAVMVERKRMADDLHDTIEQYLVGAVMLLRLDKIKEAQDVLGRAKREIRDIVWGLKNDDMMRLSPAEMLRQLAHEENTKGLYRVDTLLDGLPPEMDAASMRDLCLIVRESIGNAVKHGGARRIAISADGGENGCWRLRIANDGEQFDPEQALGAKDGHFGLEGMRQRARRLKAELSISRRKDGMVVTVERRK